MPLIGSQRCAVLLCRFSDTVDQPAQPVSFFEDLVVRRGTRSLNDYWTDVSLGMINLDGSRVFDWRTLSATAQEYRDGHPSRWDKINGAIQAFSEVDFSPYAVVIAVFNGDVGDAGNQGGVLVNFDIVNHTFIAHEMGHSFGLPHSFDTSDRRAETWSSPGEYFDRYDVMSAMNVFGAPHPRFGSVGPRLCAPQLVGQGWMPAGRRWRTPASRRSFTQTIELVSMSRPDLPGYLMADLDGYTVEFRTREGWDEGIPGSTILIHDVRGGVPYLVQSDTVLHRHEWGVGQTWENVPAALLFADRFTVHVDAYLPNEHKARLTITLTLGIRPPKIYEEWGVLLGGIKVGGGGLIIRGGKIISVGPRGPMLHLLAQLSAIEEAASSDEKALRKFQLAKFEELGKAVNEQLQLLRKQV